MTDELTGQLATMSQLRVTSRGSAMQFKGKNRPPTPEIAKTLKVDAIVEGSVIRSGDRVRITAQLIDARADKHLWSQTFERKSSDVLALQAEMASAIASAINVRLTPGEQSRLAAAPSVNPEAHEAYLKGRFFFNRPSDENLQKAIAQFNTVVQLSPTFAPAYSGLSDVYIWAAYNEGFVRAIDAKPRVKETAERAVQLDSMSAEAHTSLGVFKAWFEYDWAGSERELRRAIALNPSYAYAHDQLNQMLGLIGRFDEAIAEGERAIALDPLSPSIMDDLATTSMYAGKSAMAVDLVRKAAELDPTFFFPAATEGILALQTGQYREAIAKFERARTLDAPPFVSAYLVYAYGMSGDRRPRDGDAGGTQEDVAWRQGGALQPGTLSLGLGDRDAGPRLSRTGIRRLLGVTGLAQDRQDLRSVAIGTALHRPDEAVEFLEVRQRLANGRPHARQSTAGNRMDSGAPVLVIALALTIPLHWNGRANQLNAPRPVATCNENLALGDTARFTGLMVPTGWWFASDPHPPGSAKVWVSRDGKLNYAESWKLDTTAFVWTGEVAFGANGLPQSFVASRTRNGVEGGAERVERQGDSVAVVRGGRQTVERLDADAVRFPAVRPASASSHDGSVRAWTSEPNLSHSRPRPRPCS